MIGIAARSGVALGINLSRNSDAVDATFRKAQTHLWWAIARLEHLLSVMTGRASCLEDDSSSAPPPKILSSVSGSLPPGTSQ